MPEPVPRYWWLKRLAIWIPAVLLVWAGAHALLWHRASAGIERHVERWREDGGPLPEQVVPAAGTPTGDDNAAAWIVEAIALLPPLTDEQKLHWESATLVFPLEGQQLEATRQVTEQARPAVEAIRRAQEAPGLDWATPAVQILTRLHRLSEHRDLARRLGAGVQLHHQEGDLAEAARYGRDMFFHGEAILTDGPSIVTSLVSIGVQRLGTGTIQDIVARPPAGLNEAEAHSRWREAAPEVRELIALLLDEEAGRRALEIGLRGERTMAHSNLREWDMLGWYGSGFLSGPFFTIQISRVLDRCEAQRQLVVSARTWRGIEQVQDRPVPPEPRSLGEVLGVGVESALAMTDRRYLQVGWITQTERLATAVLLAIRLYEADHDGRLPPALEALVPDYLPHLPADPFDPEGGGFRYLPDAPGPLIYSVGFDMIDGGGDWGRSEPRVAERFRLNDVPFLLRLPPDFDGKPESFQKLLEPQ